MYFLETQRLGLRRFNKGDAGFVLELLNDPDYIANVADRGIRTLEEAGLYIESKYMAHIDEAGFGPYVVELRVSKTAMGFCGLYRRDGFDFPDVGYAFLPRYRRKGYAFESAAALVKYAREVLGLRNVYGMTLGSNISSTKLLLGLGMTYRRTLKLEGYEGDTDLYSLYP